MRTLREDERDEIESVKHFIKYVNSNSKAHPFEVYEGLMKLESIAKKYIVTGIISEEELDELLEIDDMKELLYRFMTILKRHVQGAE